jgi:hypothetical protein
MSSRMSSNGRADFSQPFVVELEMDVVKPSAAAAASL